MLKFMLRQVGETVPPSRAVLRVAGVLIYLLATALTLGVAHTVFTGMVAEGHSPMVAVAAVIGFWLYMVFVLFVLTTMTIFLYRLLRRIVLGTPDFVRGVIAFFCAIPGAIAAAFHGVITFFRNVSDAVARAGTAIAAMTLKDWLKVFFVLLGLTVFICVLVVMWPIASQFNGWIDSKIGFKPDFMHALMIDLFLSYLVCGLSYIVILIIFSICRALFSSNSKS